MAEETQAKLTAQDESLLTRFKNKAEAFMQAVDRLRAIQTVPDNLADEHKALMLQANAVHGSISYLTETVDSITGFFSNVFQFDGAQAVKRYINNETPNTLGIAPLIPVAAISGAIAMMGKFISDVYLFERKVTEQQRLVQSGVSEREAANIVDSMTGKGFTGNLAELGKPIAFALGAMVVLRMMRGIDL